MESLRDIRQNIKSINSIKQVMLTMKMISSARIKKAQESMDSSRPFAKKMEEMIDHLERDIMSPDSKLDKALVLPFFKNPEADENAIGLVFITADKGLAGAFNAMLIRELLSWIRRHPGKQKYIFCIGKKGRDFLARLKYPDIHVIYEAVGIFPKAGYVHASMLGTSVMRNYLALDLAKVDVIYNDFKSLGSQKLVDEQILPFDFSVNRHLEKPEEEDLFEKNKMNFLYEPGIEKVFMMLLPRFVNSMLYRILLESQAAELAARMNAMDSASKNAGDMVTALGVKLNKVRQSIITNEISEIVNGADALNN